MASTSCNKVGFKRHKWCFAFAAKSRLEKQGELPAPPGYSSSLGQGHAEASRETDANLIVKRMEYGGGGIILEV